MRLPWAVVYGFCPVLPVMRLPWASSIPFLSATGRLSHSACPGNVIFTTTIAALNVPELTFLLLVVTSTTPVAWRAVGWLLLAICGGQLLQCCFSPLETLGILLCCFHPLRDFHSPLQCQVGFREQTLLRSPHTSRSLKASLRYSVPNSQVLERRLSSATYSAIDSPSAWSRRWKW